MKNFKVTIEIMPLESVLDPQGEAIELIVKNKNEYKANKHNINVWWSLNGVPAVG